MNNEVITKEDERINSFFHSIEHLVRTFETVLDNYRPPLGGEYYLTDAEVSKHLKMSRRTLQQYRNNGKIPFIHLGGRILYRTSDIEKILNDSRQEMWE